MQSLSEMIIAVVINTFSGLIKNIFYILLFVWGIKMIAKKVPNWLDKYHKNKMEEMALQRAIVYRR